MQDNQGDKTEVPILGDNRKWEEIQEDESGELKDTIGEDTTYIKLRKSLRDRLGVGRSIRRGLIRYMFLAIDCSRSMAKKDDALKPNAFECCKHIGEEFINQYFDQNPISQLGLIITRNSQARRVTELTANPKAHINKLKYIEHELITDENSTSTSSSSLAKSKSSSVHNKSNLRKSGSGIRSTSAEDIIRAPKERGDASLQHVIELGITSLQYIPEYGSREILIVYGSLSSADPGDIFNTIELCKRSRVRVSIISLSAEVYICKKICEETGGNYFVVVDSTHFKDCFLSSVIPPPELNNRGSEGGNGEGKSKYMDMVLMGFPTREIDNKTALFTWDMNNLVLSRVSFKCPRCRSRVLDLPTDCSLCNLPLIFSSHIARSYHHLFPIEPYEDYLTLKTLQRERSNREKSERLQIRNTDKIDHTTTSNSYGENLLLPIDNETNKNGEGIGNDDIQYDKENENGMEPQTKRAKITTITVNDRKEEEKSKPKSSSVKEKEKQKKKGLQKKNFTCSSCLVPLSLDAEGNPKASGCKHCFNLYCIDCDLYIHDSLYNCPGCT